MAKNEPQIYRKGSARRAVLRILLWVLAVFLLLCITAFFGFRKYIAYTDTGKLYLDIPWLDGYVSGPPENDDLAEYIAPVQRQPADTPDASDTSAPPDSAAPDDASDPQSEDTSADNSTSAPDVGAQDNTDVADSADSADPSPGSTDTAADNASAHGGEAPDDVPASPAE